MKITGGKLGPFLFSFPIQATFLTEYPHVIFPSFFRIMYTNAGAITGSPRRLFLRKVGFVAGTFFTQFLI